MDSGTRGSTRTGADGSRYLLSADEARTPLDNTNVIEMIGAKLLFGRPGRSATHAHAEVANFDNAAQRVTVPGVTVLYGDDGMHGTANAIDADLTTQITLANGPVDITFSDGTHLTGATMRRDGNAQTWAFDQAVLTIPNLPALLGTTGHVQWGVFDPASASPLGVSTSAPGTVVVHP